VKKTAVYLAFLLCMALTTQAVASNYTNMTLLYLAAKHGVNESQIELFEGGIIELRVRVLCSGGNSPEWVLT